MSAGSTWMGWAILPCKVGGWDFPGLPNPADLNNADAWADLQEEIGACLARLKILEKRRLIVDSVRTVAQLGHQNTINGLLKLAQDLEKP